QAREKARSRIDPPSHHGPRNGSMASSVSATERLEGGAVGAPVSAGGRVGASGFASGWADARGRGRLARAGRSDLPDGGTGSVAAGIERAGSAGGEAGGAGTVTATGVGGPGTPRFQSTLPAAPASTAAAAAAK